MRSWYATWDSSSSMSNLSASAPPFTVTAPSAPSPDSGQNVDPGDPLRFPVNSSLNSRVSPNPTVSVPDWISSSVDPELDTVYYAGGNPYSSSYPYGDFSGGSRNSASETRMYYPEYPQYYFPELDSDKALNFDSHTSYGGLSAPRGGTVSGSVYNDKTNAFSNLSSPLHVSDLRSDTGNRGWLEPAPFWPALNSGADGSVHRSYEPQAAHSFEGFDARTEASNDALNRGYCAVSTTSELSGLDMNLFPGNNIEVLIDSPPIALSGSTSVLSQSYSSAPPLDFCVEPRNYQMGYSNLVDKCSGEQFSGQGNGYSVTDNASSARPPIAAKISERNVLFDATQHRAGQGDKSMGVGRFRFGNGDYLKNEEAVSGDASRGLSTAVSRLEVPCMVVDGLNVAHESNHAFSSSENVSEALNHYGHTVDSPCWKGVSIKRYGSSKACEIVAPTHVSEFKDLNSLNPQISQASAENDDCELNIFPQRKRVLLAQDRNMISGKYSVTPLEQPEVQHSSAPGVGFGDVLGVGPCHLRPSYSFSSQCSEGVNAPWKRNSSIDKLAGDVNVKLFKVKRNSYGHAVTSKEKQASLGDGSDLDRKVHDAIDIDLSDLSMRCVEHVLSSPPSTMEMSTKQSNFHGEELTPRIDVPLLLKTMLNLSELLLLHNSNGTSDLKDQDYEVLRKVANNLEACCLKNAELVSRSKESSSTVQDAPLFQGKSFKHQKNEEFEQQVGSSRGTDDQNCPAAVTNAAENMLSSLGGVLEKDGSNPYNKLSQMSMEQGTQLSNQKEQTDAPCNSEKHSVLPGLPEDDNPINMTPEVLADFVKQDKITQDIKRILVENFHDEVGSEPQTHLFKNLWLEAEAALCSVNYMARYNHAKLHMVKSKPENEKDGYENPTPILNNLGNNEKPNPSIPIQGSMDATGDVMDRFNILKTRETDTDYSNDFEVEHPSTEVPDTSPLQTTFPHTDNIEFSSVIERFSILKQRQDDTNSTKSDDFTTRVTDIPTNQPSAITESSVMARFSILKQREGVESSRKWNLAALEAINLESAVQQDYFPEENTDSDFSGYALLPQDGGVIDGAVLDCGVIDGAVLDSVVVDGGAALEQSNASLDSVLPLEWEHVQREEINVQNP